MTKSSYIREHDMKAKHSFTLANGRLIEEVKEHFKASNSDDRDMYEFFTGAESASAIVDSALKLFHQWTFGARLVFTPYAARELKRKYINVALVACNERLEQDCPSETRRFFRFEDPGDEDHFGISFMRPGTVDVDKFDTVLPEQGELERMK